MNLDDVRTLVDADENYLFNSYRHLPKPVRLAVADATLNMLDSDTAFLYYSVADIAYLRRLWVRIRERWDAYENDEDKQNAEQG